MKLTVCIVAALLVIGSAHAQSDSRPAFEVASVKQRIMPAGRVIARPHSNSGEISCANTMSTELFDCGISGTRFSDSPASLLDLIIDAYNVRENAVFGLPDWGNSGHDIYDVNARVPGDKTPTLDQVRLMLQTLLADRFQLRAHRETKEVPVYDLVVAKKPRLFKSAKACGARTESPSTDDVVPIPVRWEQIPTRLSGNADRPVIDKTGFDAEARYCLPGRDADPTILLMKALHPPLPAMPTPKEDVANAVNELEDTLGLRLVPRKVPMEIFVVDHAERPSGN